MTMRRAESLAAALLATGILGCGAGGGAVTSSPGLAQPTAGVSSGAAISDPNGYVPYERITVDPAAGTSALTTSASCPVPTTSTALTADAPSSALGVFAVSMVDAPNPLVKEIWVSIESVSVHVAGKGWIPLGTWDPPEMVDLLKLQATAMKLGFATLPAGTVTQIRLVVTPDVSTGSGVGEKRINYVVLVDENEVRTEFPLKTPSGYESGLKIMGPWVVEGCQKTEVTIDFDGKQSIWYHPTGRETELGTEWILRPVIRVKGVVKGPIACPTPPTTSATKPPPPPTNLPVGATCSAAGECASGICTSSVCVAATNPSPTNLPVGATCSAAGECASGICTSSVCVAAPNPPPTNLPIGAACGTPTECISGSCNDGYCAAGGPNAYCGTPTECLSNTCTNSTCDFSAVGGMCNQDSDCASGLCGSGTCLSPPTTTLLPAGAKCSTPVECVTNVCSGVPSTCQIGYPGSTCLALTDCDQAQGLRCVIDPCTKVGSCQFWSN